METLAGLARQWFHFHPPPSPTLLQFVIVVVFIIIAILLFLISFSISCLFAISFLPPMENSKEAAVAGAKAGGVQNLTSPGDEAEAAVPEPAQRQPSRRPFTDLSQIDADLALARALQEQEAAFMMLHVDDGEEYVDGDELDGYDDGEFAADYYEEEGYYGDDAEIFDDGVIEIDPAYAAALGLQEADVEEFASRLMAMAGLNNWTEQVNVDQERGGGQDGWGQIDPDELTYEELIALGDVVGTESRGLSSDTIESLPSFLYKAESTRDSDREQCVVCRMDYEDGDSLAVLGCKHSYHSECINKWLQISKACPVCNSEVSASGSGGRRD